MGKIKTANWFEKEFLEKHNLIEKLKQNDVRFEIYEQKDGRIRLEVFNECYKIYFDIYWEIWTKEFRLLELQLQKAVEEELKIIQEKKRSDNQIHFSENEK